MRSIPSGTENAQWSNSLFNDLVFIKKHLRYPFSKKTLLILPFTSLLFILLWTVRTIYMTVYLKAAAPPFVVWLMIGLMITGLISAVYRYYHILKFRGITAPFPVNENIKLVNEFLRSQQLNVFRHPQAPEVFQILSRPLGGNTEQREVMIFIADDRRILINSHFTNQTWAISPQSRNYRKMANRLQEWLKIHYPDTGTAVMA